MPLSTGRARRKHPAKQGAPTVASPPARDTRSRLVRTPALKARLAVTVVVLSLIAILPYANTLRNGFVWDDHQQVVMNSSLRPETSLARLAAPNVWGFSRQGSRPSVNYYRPLQMLAYRLTTAGFGFDASAFHAVNVAFHLIVVLLACAVFHALLGRWDLSFAAAALFAVHPIHSEAVDWIAALPDLGCTLCFLLAFLCFARARDHSSISAQGARIRGPSLALWAASCTAFAAALLWKETAIVFPLVVMVFVCCRDQTIAPARRIRDAFTLSLPYWFILCGYVWLRLRVLGFVVTRQRNWILRPFDVSLTVITLLSSYFWKLLAPLHLNAYYTFEPVRTFMDLRAILAIVFLIFSASAILYGLRRAPLLSFAALWIVLTLIPVLNVYAVGRNVFAERYLYLPSVGFCLLMVLLAAWAGRPIPHRFRAPTAAVVSILVLLTFAARTFARNPDWQSDATLFTRTQQDSPNAPFVQNMVAALQPNDPAGRMVAESHYLRAMALAQAETPPNRLELAIGGEGLATIYSGRGEFDRALSVLAQVRAEIPDDPEIDGEQGLILAQVGRWSEAEAALRRAVAITPNNPNVLNALGLIAWQHHGQLPEAAEYFLRALAEHTEADDFNASLHNNLGAVYGQQSRYSEAIEHFELAVQISPQDPEYLTNLATAFAAVGRIEDARRELQSALAAAPNYSPARQVLQQILIR